MWFTMALGGVAAAVALHAVVRRLPINVDSVTSFVVVSGVLGVGLLTSVIRDQGATPPAIAAVLTYAAMCEVYVFLFTFVSSSVSAGILLAILGGKTSLDDVDPSTSPTAMVDSRLAKMVRVGLLETTEGRFVVSRKGRALMAAFLKLRGFFHLARR